VLVDHVWSNIRVFLPAGRPSSAVQLGGDRLAPQLERLAERATVAPRASAVAGRDGDFDLVAVEAAALDDIEAVLSTARRLITPDGSLVVTSSGHRRGLRVRRSLGSGVRRSVSLPNVRRPAVLIDLDGEQAGRYFLRRVAFAYRAPDRRGIRARMMQLRNRIGMAAPPRLTLAATSERVYVKRGPNAPPPLIEEIGDDLRSSWDRLDLPGEPPRRFATLAIAHRKTPTAIVSVILLGGDVPIVVKVPRYGGRNAALGRESQTLEGVFSRVSGPIRGTLPRPLGMHGIAGTDVFLQTVVPGRHLIAETATRRLSRDRLRHQFDLMFSWTAELQAASERWVVVDDALIEGTLAPLAEKAIRALGDDPSVRHLLDRALEDARRLRGTPLRLCVVHGDFWAGNVLVGRGRVTGVVDWERAEIEGLPFWDPFKAVMDAAYHLDRYRAIPRRGASALPRWGRLGPWEGIADPRCATGFRAAMVDRSWLSETAREDLALAFAKLEIPLGWLPVAVPFHLVREFVHADVSDRSVESWGSVLRALARHPGTWADPLAGDRRGARPRSTDRMGEPSAPGGRR